MQLDTTSIRSHFPALSRTQDRQPVIWADGPGGTQVPESVIDAMSGFLRRGGSDHGGFFEASRDSDEVHREARSALADLLGASSQDEIAFGQNMTSLTLVPFRPPASGASVGEGDPAGGRESLGAARGEVRRNRGGGSSHQQRSVTYGCLS